MLAPPPAAAGDATLYQAATVQTASLSPIEEALTRADGYFITQYYHKKYNPAQAQVNNANCGPTSLAMAVRAFGVEPSGMEASSTSNELIRTVRQAMTGRVDESTWTYPVQVRDGARKFGLSSKIVFGLPAIKEAMSVPGRLMVININPSPAYADKLAIPYNGGHFALLTRITGDKAYVSDPLGAGPIVISLKQLDMALTTPLGSDPNGTYVAPYNGGILLWR
jgi:hypothetical protein